MEGPLSCCLVVHAFLWPSRIGKLSFHSLNFNHCSHFRDMGGWVVVVADEDLERMPNLDVCSRWPAR